MESMVFEWVRIGFELLLGGGLWLTVRSVRTLKHDIDKAKHEAEALRIENERSAMDTMQTYIVQPVKKEINVLRREMARLRKAIDKVKNCAYSQQCPVTFELQRSEELGASEPYGDGFANPDDNG